MVAKLSNLEFTMEVLYLAKSYSVKCIQMFYTSIIQNHIQLKP